MKGIDGNLIPPFTIRLAYHWVDEYFKYQCKISLLNTHTISNPFVSIRFIPTRKPTVNESKTCVYINLTPNTSDWNPYCMHYADQESYILYYSEELGFPTLHKRFIVQF